MAMDIDSFINEMAGRLGLVYTDEQIEFIRSFDKTMFCFASPGTGKTMSSIGGLLTAELMYKVPGNKIYAMSFTNMATAELAGRHLRACRKLGIRDTINFITLHKMCTAILKENFAKLGMTSITFTDDLPMQRWVEVICKHIEIPEVKVPRIVRAIHKLNSSLVFNQLDIEESYAFKECDVSYEVFEQIRGYMMLYGIVIQQVPVSDILLTTLLLLTREPSICEEFREKCELMLVDEAQDLSLLQLKIISMLAKRVILIGDMKQQIYAFNGACAEIVDNFFKFYPDAIKLQLSQSFRCKNEIADYATEIIQGNDIFDAFHGTTSGGNITISNQFDMDAIVSSIKQDYEEHDRRYSKDILFLFRNNASAIPIAERLYAERLPFRVNNYKKIYELPVIKDLVALCQLAQYPDVASNVGALQLLIPELRQYRAVEECPLYKIMRKTGQSVFEINYQFQDSAEATDAFNMLYTLGQRLKEGCSLKDAFNIAWSLYNDKYLKHKAFLLEYPPEYYIKLVEGIMHNKTLATLIQREDEKVAFIKQCNDIQYGIRCYTMHAAKGLEADDVYILNADEGLVPNMSQLEKVIKKGCDYEAAKALRNERALVYVAVTRAKTNLTIQYSKELSAMFKPGEVNEVYSRLDAQYKLYKTESIDVENFVRFCEVYINGKL